MSVNREEFLYEDVEEPAPRFGNILFDRKGSRPLDLRAPGQGSLLTCSLSSSKSTSDSMLMLLLCCISPAISKWIYVFIKTQIRIAKFANSALIRVSPGSRIARLCVQFATYAEELEKPQSEGSCMVCCASRSNMEGVQLSRGRMIVMKITRVWLACCWTASLEFGRAGNQAGVVFSEPFALELANRTQQR